MTALTLNFVHHPTFPFLVCRIFGEDQMLPDGLERLVGCANSLLFENVCESVFWKPLAGGKVRNCEHEWRRLRFLYLRCWLSLAGC